MCIRDSDITTPIIYLLPWCVWVNTELFALTTGHPNVFDRGAHLLNWEMNYIFSGIIFTVSEKVILFPTFTRQGVVWVLEMLPVSRLGHLASLYRRLLHLIWWLCQTTVCFCMKMSLCKKSIRLDHLENKPLMRKKKVSEKYHTFRDANL